MNKQELIERIKNMPYENGILMDFVKINRSWLLKTIKQLEPEKVTLPQCAHKYIQEAKDCSWDLQDLLKYIDDEDNMELQRWFYHECNQETIAKAWIFGYEVEKEKRYEVILCNGQSLKTVYRQGEDRLDFVKEYGDLESFTRKQLEEANFGWVFDCPGIEIEEVEE